MRSSGRRPSRPGRWFWALPALAVAAAGFLVFRHADQVPSLRRELCSVSVGETFAELDLEQSRYASLIAATGVRRGLPARASTIALATAYQESKIRNVDYGDRDSLGLFQQRPSQGWGTSAQVSDPSYAIGRFFDALVTVDGYEAMPVTRAAQRVQRSAYGGAYAEHEDYARALASALTGQSAAAYTCQIRPGDDPTPQQATARATRLKADVRAAYGRLERTSKGGTVTYATDDNGLGWSVAQYAVANAKRLRVMSVAFDGRRWTAVDSPKGWVRTPVSGTGVRVFLG